MKKISRWLAGGTMALAACAHPQPTHHLSHAVPLTRQEIPSRDIIRSQAELNNYLRLTPNNSSPLRYLTADARERFLASLRFNQRGVTTFGYADLQAQLPASEIHEILALFGLQKDTSLIALRR
ncbi:MAG TPA: hypothetical protein VGG51_13530 [Candidatus Cybelea sp.]|jgi:hypothetical protein